MGLNSQFCKVVLPRTAYFEEPSGFSQQKGNFLPGFPAPSNSWQKFLSKKCWQFPPNIIIWKPFNSRLLHTSLRSRTTFLSSSGNQIDCIILLFDSELYGSKVQRINPNDRSSSLISFILLRTIINVGWLRGCFVESILIRRVAQFLAPPLISAKTVIKKFADNNTILIVSFLIFTSISIYDSTSHISRHSIVSKVQKTSERF